MTIKYGPLMLDVEGLTLDDSDRKILQSPAVGGLILFSRNFKDTEQLNQLINEIRLVAPDIIIAVDHEGGRVQRFRHGFTRIPPMAELGAEYFRDRSSALVKARELGWLIAQELIAYDIDISFTPVLDRDYGISEVIGDRAFSTEPEAIVALSISFIEGMRQGGMASTGKHYPGHGAVSADSHVDIPIDDRDLQEIIDEDMSVFSKVMSAGLNAVMPAHVIYSKVDPKPAGFSKFWIEKMLRQDLKFEGVVFSDDLSMEGATVAGTFPERADAALEAGCDMVLVCNNRAAAIEVAEHLEQLLTKDHLSDSSERIATMKFDHKKKQTVDAVRRTSIWKKYN